MKGNKGGFFGFITLSLDPKGRRAMKGNRYPITEAGLAKVVTRVLKDVKKGEAEGVLQLSDKPSVEVFGRRSRMITIRSSSWPSGFSVLGKMFQLLKAHRLFLTMGMLFPFIR